MGLVAKLSPAWGRHFEYFVPPTVAARSVVFENGAKLTVRDDGSVGLVWADGCAVCRTCALPEVDFPDGPAAWTFADVTADFNVAVVRYVSSGGRVLRWSFKSGQLNLDDRKYFGIAESASVEGGAARIRFRTDVTPGVLKSLRRMSVKDGYAGLPLAKGMSADTGTWRPFADGQPFTYVTGFAGVYAGMPVGVEDLSLRMTKAAGGSGVCEERCVTFASGERETEFWWHWFSAGPENGDNDYLARWQYVRQFLRRRYALHEWPAAPVMRTAFADGPASRVRLSAYRTVEAAGTRLLEKGMNPLVLDGADLSAHDLSKAPFALVGMAPAAVRGVDALVAAAYGAFPRAGAPLAPEVRQKVDEALKLTVTPFVRAADFGTVWVGKDGGAVFVLREADEIDVRLPPFWKIRGVAGTRIKGAKAGAVYLVEAPCFGGEGK